jgi:membrane-associated phospholipid phosphatase
MAFASPAAFLRPIALAPVVAAGALMLMTPLALASDLPAPAEPPAPPSRATFKQATRTFFDDGGYLVTFPKRTTARGVWLTAGFVAGTAILINRDQEIRRWVLEQDGPTARRIATKFEPLGRSQTEAAALGLAYLSGRLAHRPRLTETSARAFEAYLWTAILVSASKAAFGREAPDEGSGEGRFFAGSTVFPSGHTARSFAIAAVFADRYGAPGAWIAYPVAALVGLSTVEEDLHWASDVLAGAGLGLAIGKGIVARHPAADRARRAEWRVLPARGGAMVHITF